MGARLLRVAQDFDALETQGLTPALALDALERRTGVYDPHVLAAMRRLLGVTAQNAVVREMRLADVLPGMVFASDVLAPNGLLLVARGQEVTASLQARIQNSWVVFADQLLVRMIVGRTSPVAPAPALQREA